jgi:hypothetical protein
VILVAVTEVGLATVLAKEAAKEAVMEAVMAVEEVTECRISEPRCLSSG